VPRPIGITFLTIFWIVAGISFLLDFMVYLAYSSWASSPEGRERLVEALSEDVADALTGILLILAIVYLAIGISALLLSRGLFKGYEPARRKARRVAAFAIAFAILGAIILGEVLPERVYISVSWWSILFNMAVVIYLGRPGVKAFFVNAPG
jgi:hypothetical protein